MQTTIDCDYLHTGQLPDRSVESHLFRLCPSIWRVSRDVAQFVSSNLLSVW